MEKYIEIAKILNTKLQTVINYFKVWGELYDLENSTSNELAEMITDIYYCYE